MGRKDKNKEDFTEEQEVRDENAATEDAVEEKAEPTIEEKYNALNDKYLRLYSDFDNFRKRSIKEKADIIGSASSSVLKDMLPILDDFDRAIENNAKSEDVDGLKEGFKLIHHKLDSTLKSKGLELAPAKGEVFDPEIHEAITNIPAPTEDLKGKVVDVIEKGYNLKGKPLRFAKVVVGQ
ncbi:nucleotide exchange factor GrpE [Putridiphycobacter roseus]|uniref:Protein GrpE n=1 Tax=Putridiphycobacter roseus TaxID=2219161 RepID=A0A2W1NEI6_9FLAO|nr:nucleotide exchange factor GrpE [Putridiphycobacter roseus]PZE17845.1 nucleotide exchange factor GrpE [Putridiphycobacter roseus]